MPGYGYAILVAGWLTWLMPLLLARRLSPPVHQRDTRARWGLLIEAVAYAILAQGVFSGLSPTLWRVALAILFFLPALVLSWTSARALGRHLRIDAGLSADHQLVTSGVYAVVRHPIYTSMLCVLLGTGLVIAPLRLLALATVVFLVGTEIRVRVEEGLLQARFGEAFSEYKRRVPAYFPYIR